MTAIADSRFERISSRRSRRRLIGGAGAMVGVLLATGACDVVASPPPYSEEARNGLAKVLRPTAVSMAQLAMEADTKPRTIANGMYTQYDISRTSKDDSYRMIVTVSMREGSEPSPADVVEVFGHHEHMMGRGKQRRPVMLDALTIYAKGTPLNMRSDDWFAQKIVPSAPDYDWRNLGCVDTRTQSNAETGDQTESVLDRADELANDIKGSYARVIFKDAQISYDHKQVAELHKRIAGGESCS